MARALVLGSGAALPARGRFNTSLAIMEGARTLLLDCAQPASELLYHHGVDYTSVDIIVLTHMHADHVTGLGQLLHMKHHFIDCVAPRALLDREKTLFKGRLRYPPQDKWNDVNPWVNIYVPEGVEEVIKQYLRAIYMRPEVFTNFKIDVLPLRSGTFYRDNDFRVTAYPNAHIREYYPELSGTDAVLSSYSILVECGRRKLLYSSDLASLTEIEPLVADADVVFIEGAHFPPSQILDFVRKHSLKRVFIHHILATREEEIATLREELLKHNVTPTKDGLELEI